LERLATTPHGEEVIDRALRTSSFPPDRSRLAEIFTDPDQLRREIRSERNKFLAEAERGLFDRIRGELDLIERRLIGERKELYAESDRLRSESEFRLALAPPLFVLAVALALTESYWYGFGVFVAVILYWQGVRRIEQRNDLLIDALVLDRVKSPTVERLEAQVNEPEIERASLRRADEAEVP
jgi:hypothetical protein